MVHPRLKAVPTAPGASGSQGKRAPRVSSRSSDALTSATRLRDMGQQWRWRSQPDTAGVSMRHHVQRMSLSPKGGEKVAHQKVSFQPRAKNADGGNLRCTHTAQCQA